jgi:glutamine synthetase
MFKSPKEAVKFIKDEGVTYVDLRFSDVPGRWQHYTRPSHQVTEELFKEGAGFDGSSIQGFQQIQESDMLLLPDVASGFVDPFFREKTLVFICDVHTPPIGGQEIAPYGKDPRGVAKRAEAYLKETGIADTSYFGPEAEFFIFDGVAFNTDPYNYGFQILTTEAHVDSSEFGDGYWVRKKEGYFPCPPSDKNQDLRTEMVTVMESIGVTVELHHHEVASDQGEIDMRFDSLTNMADKVQKYKYVVRNVAKRYGKTVTFMPKPIFGDNGSGMHCHQSLWKGGKPLFADDSGYAGLSKIAMHYVAGLLAHGPALAAITNPSVNSYRRLVPGYEAPVNLIISARNRSAVIRVPMYSTSPKAKRVEYRAPDPTANPYFAFSAMLLAGLDGIQRELMPPNPVDKNLYSLSAREARRIKQLPKSLDEALAALEKDHEFLLKGGVFTSEILESHFELKQAEADAARLRPSPIEYSMYFDL